MLAESDEAGLFLAMADGGRKIFVMGHPEYDRVTLDGEYKRDAQKPAHRNPGELLQRQQPGKQTAPYVESTCEQPVYKLVELLRLPVNSIRPVWNTGFQRDLKGLWKC